MEETPTIIFPAGLEDKAGAQKVFEEFLVLYQPALAQAEQYLEKVIEENPDFSEAYRPWLKALHEMLRGVYLVAKRIPLPDPDAFLDALKMFSFDSSIKFLRDLCRCCQLSLPLDWSKRFREHVDMLLFSAAILNSQQPALAR